MGRKSPITRRPLHAETNPNPDYFPDHFSVLLYGGNGNVEELLFDATNLEEAGKVLPYVGADGARAFRVETSGEVSEIDAVLPFDEWKKGKKRMYPKRERMARIVAGDPFANKDDSSPAYCQICLYDDFGNGIPECHDEDFVDGSNSARAFGRAILYVGSPLVRIFRVWNDGWCEELVRLRPRNLNRRYRNGKARNRRRVAERNGTLRKIPERKEKKKNCGTR